MAAVSRRTVISLLVMCPCQDDGDDPGVTFSTPPPKTSAFKSPVYGKDRRFDFTLVGPKLELIYNYMYAPP